MIIVWITYKKRDMSDYEKLKSDIASVIKNNGAGEITGAALQEQMLNIVDTLNEGKAEASKLTELESQQGVKITNYANISNDFRRLLGYVKVCNIWTDTEVDLGISFIGILNGKFHLQIWRKDGSFFLNYVVDDIKGVHHFAGLVKANIYLELIVDLGNMTGNASSTDYSKQPNIIQKGLIWEYFPYRQQDIDNQLKKFDTLPSTGLTYDSILTDNSPVVVGQSKSVVKNFESSIFVPKGSCLMLEFLNKDLTDLVVALYFKASSGQMFTYEGADRSIKIMESDVYISSYGYNTSVASANSKMDFTARFSIGQRAELEQLKEKSNESFAQINTSFEKNKYFIFLSEQNAIKNKYVNPIDGVHINLQGYCASDYLPVIGGATYNFGVFQKLYCAWYDEQKRYISGIQRDGLTTEESYVAPKEAHYICISSKTDSYVRGVVWYDSVFLNPNIQKTIIKHTTITIKPSGGGDFNSISEALKSIKDSSYYNRYIVEFYGNGEEFDMLNDCPYEAGSHGLFIPPFTKLVGIGGKDKCILVRRLQSPDEHDCMFNLYGTSELEGFTLIGKNTRYVIHDDFFTSEELELNSNYTRSIQNCEIRTEGTYYKRCWGAGIRSGFRWRFENVIFENALGASDDSFSCHNNVDFTDSSYITFINCRFNADNGSCIRLGSLNTNANHINNYVVFQGCKMNSIRLSEEAVGLYGAGILFKVSGFANDLKNGDNKIVINSADGIDYSGNIDLL